MISSRDRFGRAMVLALPVLWLGVFLVAPLAIVLAISLSTRRLGQPPFEPLLALDGEGGLRVAADLANYAYLFDDPLYVLAYLSSLWIAFVATLICLAVGYPIALAIARAPPRWRMPLLLLVILPFWTSLLVRIYAWTTILAPSGLLNALLLALGVIERPLVLVDSDGAIMIGLVYAYLPFMVLPLYAALERQDPALLEAAADLGSRPWLAFLQVTLPLSLPGIVAGSLLVFIPAVGEFVIPSLLGGADTLMIGKVLWDEFFLNTDWPVASAVAVALVLVLVVPVAILQGLLTRGEP